MTGYVADLSWKSGARAIEKLDRLRSTMAVNVLINYPGEGVRINVELLSKCWNPVNVEMLILFY